MWFELLMTSSYLGIAYGLLEDALATPRASDATVVNAWAQLASTKAALAHLASQLDAGVGDDQLLGQMLLCRYQLQAAMPAVGAGCLEAL